MTTNDEIRMFSEACMGLSITNLRYVIAVANALKFTEEMIITDYKQFFVPIPQN